jgi:hypothetical protein
MSFINEISWKCLLGPQAKNIKENNNIYTWEVGKKKHFTCNKDLTIDEIKELSGHSFHYLSETNIINIKSLFKVNKTKVTSVGIKLGDFNISGVKNSGLRHSINSASKSGLIIKDSLNNISDLKEMLSEWSNVLAEKYFRDFSGKSLNFYSNNYHKDCLNFFLYKEDKLMSFASVNIGDNCSYVNGKALCNKIHGLSEYTDYIVYNKLKELNINKVNLGRAATKGLLFYKMKFPGAYKEVSYDGNY